MKEIQPLPQSPPPMVDQEAPIPQATQANSLPTRTWSEYTAPFMPGDPKERDELQRLVDEENRKLKGELISNQGDHIPVYGSQEWMEQKSVPDFLNDGPVETITLPPTFQAAYGPNSTLGVMNASPSIVAPTFGRMIQFGGGMTVSAPTP